MGQEQLSELDVASRRSLYKAQADGQYLGMVERTEVHGESPGEVVLHVPKERGQQQGHGPCGSWLPASNRQQDDRAGNSIGFDRTLVGFKLSNGLKHRDRGEAVDLPRQDGRSFFELPMNGMSFSTPSIIPGFSITSESSS